MDTYYSHSRPTLDNEEVEAVSTVISSGLIAQGEYVQRFESEFARYFGVEEAVAVSSGTAALHLSILALNIGSGDDVIIPSYVCSSLLYAVESTGAKPVIVDIDEKSFNINVKSIKEKITKRTKAVIVPHMFGQPVDIDKICELGIPVIEDCAQSVGAKYGDRYVGLFGKASIFSFYATKVITTGEGGMVISADRELLMKVRDMREYDEKLDFRLRFNYKLTDMAAAMGTIQLKKLMDFITKRMKIAERYSESFKDLPCILPGVKPKRDHIFFRYVIQVESGLEKLISLLKERGVMCRKPVFMPLHRITFSSECHITDNVFQRALSIPIYPSLSEGDTEYICDAVRGSFKQMS